MELYILLYEQSMRCQLIYSIMFICIYLDKNTWANTSTLFKFTLQKPMPPNDSRPYSISATHSNLLLFLVDVLQIMCLYYILAKDCQLSWVQKAMFLPPPAPTSAENFLCRLPLTGNCGRNPHYRNCTIAPASRIHKDKELNISSESTEWVCLPNSTRTI